MAFLEIANLRKSFASPEGGDLPVVEVEEFTMQAGDQLALRGTSGSGKTTFLHLIAGILKPDDGAIHIDGECISEFREARRDLMRAHSIGYVFQSFNLLQGYTCLENLLLPMAFAGSANLYHVGFLTTALLHSQ